MKFPRLASLLLILALALTAVPMPVFAQAEPPAGNAMATGMVTGRIINQNDPSKPAGELDVMLHVLDKDLNQLTMLHSQSTEDGAFAFQNVPVAPGEQFAAMATYEDARYTSQLVPVEDGQAIAQIELPVYESTTDLSKVEIERAQYIFNPAPDGLELKEILYLSNLGDRTVKEGIQIPGNNEVKAAAQFPLPEYADFVYFTPQTEGRFYTFPGGFADLDPLVPGRMISKLEVNYVLPYSNPFTVHFATPLFTERAEFFLARDSGVALQSERLAGPEPLPANNGQLYDGYRLEKLQAGEGFDLTFEGALQVAEEEDSQPAPSALTHPPLLALGTGAGGIGLFAVGIFLWARSSQVAEEEPEDETGSEGQNIESHELEE